MCRSLMVLLTSVILSSIASAQVYWAPDFTTGMQYAAQVKKPAFVYFYTMRANDCIRFQQEVFSDASVISYLNNNYISIPVDAAGDRNLPNQYGVLRVPTVLLVDPAGREYSRLVTYHSAPRLLSALQSVEIPGQQVQPAESRYRGHANAVFLETFDSLRGWGNNGSSADTTVQLSLVRGVQGQAFQVNYRLVNGPWNYIQFHRELDSSQYFRLPSEYTVIFHLAGTGGANSLDMKFVDIDGTNYGATIDIPTDFKGHKYVITSDEIGFLWGDDQNLGEVVWLQFAVTPPKNTMGRPFDEEGAVYFDELVILPGTPGSARQ